MATAGTRWAIVMSRGAGYSDQVLHFRKSFLIQNPFGIEERNLICIYFSLHVQSQVVELDFLYPSEGIHRRWDNGYRITSTAATWDQAAFVLSVPRRKPTDETQETLRTSAFPSAHVKVNSESNFPLFITNSMIILVHIWCFVSAG